jgi:hypothetical protein
VETLIDTMCLPAAERFGAWQEMCGTPPFPCYLHCAEPGEFSGRAGAGELGQLGLLSLSSLGRYEFRRPPVLVRRSDPDQFRLVLSVSGSSGVVFDNRAVPLCPGDLVLADTSRPVSGWRGGADGLSRWLMVSFPRRLVPVPDAKTRALIGHPLPGGPGLGGLVSGLIRQTAADPAQFRPSEAPRLAGVLLDLLAVLVAHHTDELRLAQPEARKQALLLQVRGFIERHLGDPHLSPGMIAAAHHDCPVGIAGCRPFQSGLQTSIRAEPAGLPAARERVAHAIVVSWHGKATSLARRSRDSVPICA